MSLPVPPGCRHFSDQILIWDPLQTFAGRRALQDDSTPQVILLYTWADAQPRHYLKYVEGYQELFPQAKIIITKATTLKTFFGGQKAAQIVVRDMVHRELIPLFTKVTDTKTGSDKPTQTTKKPRILAHVFSNSGGLGLEATASVWHEVFGVSTPLPLKTLILDSTPGGRTYHTEFSRWTAGIALGFKFPLPKSIIWAIAATIVTLLMVIPEVLGIETIATRGPRSMNTPAIISLDTTRLYLYSTADPLILVQTCRISCGRG